MTSVWRTAICLLVASTPVHSAQPYQFQPEEEQLLNNVCDAFNSNDTSRLHDLHDNIVSLTCEVFDLTHELRNNGMPEEEKNIHDIKDAIQKIKALNDEKNGQIQGEGKTINDIVRVQGEINAVQKSMSSLIAQSDPNAFIESTFIQSDIDSLTTLKCNKHRDIFDARKKLELTQLNICNLSALLNLRSHTAPEDFSETIKKQSVEIATLKGEYNEELGRISKLSDDGEKVLVEEKVQLIGKKIESYAKFKEEIAQFDFEEIERKLQSRIEKARNGLRSIQHDVEKMVQGQVFLEDPAATLRSLKSILDNVKNAREQSKNTIQQCEHQIELVESQNTDLNKKIAEQRLILELQRRQQEDYRGANSKDLEKVMHKIHKLNLGLIKANTEIRATEDGIESARESIRSQETVYMGLFTAGSIASYLYFFLSLI